MDKQRNKDKDVSVELQQVGAYATKQEMHDTKIPLFEDKADNNCAPCQE
ncbi:hypothetical protein KDJ56_11945 [Brevibacillus composti]|uniref:Uncharacterized protein n=1 Tax=Brevibacillus composti TaxID=2796470 RepID=A0A7T5EHK0_9BACL|nr:hypothetical protein [Brevibacillus composti]QQE72686.1 hypothetical protein JD108_12000 [Brevibacillus composti]QUO39764.1 hypothetical protein KDJ56_11945 [Brevibacillus composti]